MEAFEIRRLKSMFGMTKCDIPIIRNEIIQLMTVSGGTGGKSGTGHFEIIMVM